MDKNIYEYQRITEKDISTMWGMPPVVEQPCRDIIDMREKLQDASMLTYLCFVYKWGMIQGQRMERAKGSSISAKITITKEFTVDIASPNTDDFTRRF